MLITILTIMNIALAIILVILVILQQGKGSDLGSAFGGGSSNSIFGAVGPSNFLGRLTTIIAAIFLISCLAQAYLLKQSNTQEIFNIDDSLEIDVEQEVPTE